MVIRIENVKDYKERIVAKYKEERFFYNYLLSELRRSYCISFQKKSRSAGIAVSDSTSYNDIIRDSL